MPSRCDGGYAAWIEAGLQPNRTSHKPLRQMSRSATTKWATATVYA